MASAPVSTLFDEITDFLASAPSAEQIVEFKPSEAMDQRMHYLLDQNSRDLLTLDEREELDEFLRLNHFLKMLKLKTRLKLANEK